jgi:plasmid stabilization system protein ParE
MAYSVAFTPEARAKLIALYRHIAIDASPAIAHRFTASIVNHCERFRELPARSVRRDDISASTLRTCSAIMYLAGFSSPYAVYF